MSTASRAYEAAARPLTPAARDGKDRTVDRTARTRLFSLCVIFSLRRGKSGSAGNREGTWGEMEADERRRKEKIRGDRRGEG